MKTKPILITLGSLAVLVCIFFFVKAKFFNKPKQGEITQFLSDFDAKLRSGKTDSVLTYFQLEGGNGQLHALIETLNGTMTNVGIKVNADIKAAKITFINPELATAVIPVTFSRDSIENKNSTLTFTIRKTNGQFKIINVKADTFLYDYIAYQNLVRSKTISEKEIYSPITLAAFKTAESLKAKYDSVLWFAHIHQKTYYYVVKGKWDMQTYMDSDKANSYQMGLVGPDLKEIIPPEYDLIHNIGGTFDGLIEVEKNHKRGFYNLAGKIVVPVDYDQVFPVTGGANMAALRKGTDYHWLKNDTTVSDKADIKISDIMATLKQAGSNTYKADNSDNVTEFNSHEVHGTVYITPSYLVDLNIMPAIKSFINPLRNNVNYDDASSKYVVNLDAKTNDNTNWLTAAYYSIRDYFLGGRAEFYDTKNVTIVDKKSNRVYSFGVNSSSVDDDEGDVYTSSCSEYNLKALSDSLFELKTSSIIGAALYTGEILQEGPVYHYLILKDNKLVEKSTNRLFAFTKFVKMDDSYIRGCYLYKPKPDADAKPNGKQSTVLNQETLRYMKNEIFADYHYKFKDSVWTNAFLGTLNGYKAENESVDDSLTAIDKYNLNWINQKLQGPQGKKLALR